MKRLLFGFALLLVATACQNKHWTPEQRARLHDQIRAYREWRYLVNMNDAEFAMLADDVAALVESNYANLNDFVATPGSQDSLKTTVVGVMTTYVTTDARNMRYLFPYRHLVREKVLPEGLSHEQLRQFYKCMADKINSGYVSMQNFLWNAMSGNVSQTVVGTIQRDCAAPFMIETSELAKPRTHHKDHKEHKEHKESKPKEKSKDKDGK